ncbi:MAG: gliding motility protein GldC [Salibacteraceae bacterium]
MSKRTSEIHVQVHLDENHVPSNLYWEAEDANGRGSADSIMLSVWDKNEKNSLRIDLWTKDMRVDDMKIFFHQQLMSMADTFERATGEDKMAAEMRDFGRFFGERMEIIRRVEDK